MPKTKFIILILMTVITSCTSIQKKQEVVEHQSFHVPDLPAILTTPEQKAEFIITHYWNNFNFSDTTLISRADITEQAFTDFVNILPRVPEQLIEKGVTAMMDKAAINSAMYAHFMELSEKYFYDPNSPFRNEAIYVMILRNIVFNAKLDSIYKVRPQYQLDMALRNCVGNKATDFEYITEKRVEKRLYNITGNPLLLFFFRPDCPTCKEVKEYVVRNGIDKQVKILFVNPDENIHLDTVYDLRASPTLYLLDKDKKVLLKDASIEQIEQYLKDNNPTFTLHR